MKLNYWIKSWIVALIQIDEWLLNEKILRAKKDNIARSSCENSWNSELN